MILQTGSRYRLRIARAWASLDLSALRVYPVPSLDLAAMTVLPRSPGSQPEESEPTVDAVAS